MKYAILCALFAIAAGFTVDGRVCYECNSNNPNQPCNPGEEYECNNSPDEILGKGCFTYTRISPTPDFMTKSCSIPLMDQWTNGEFKCVDVSVGEDEWGTFCLCEEDLCNAWIKLQFKFKYSNQKYQRISDHHSCANIHWTLKELTVRREHTFCLYYACNGWIHILVKYKWMGQCKNLTSQK